MTHILSGFCFAAAGMFYVAWLFARGQHEDAYLIASALFFIAVAILEKKS